MKNIALLALLFVLCGCKSVEESTETIFECMNRAEENGGCTYKDSEEIVSLEIKNYVSEGDYIDNIDVYTFEGHVSVNTEVTTLYVRLKLKDQEITESHINFIAQLAEDLYEDVFNEGQDRISIIIDLENETSLGHNLYRIEKSYIASECDYFVFYKIDQISVDIINEEKSIIEAVLSYQNDYRISYSFTYSDETIEKWNERSAIFSMESAIDSDAISVWLYLMSDKIVLDFEQQDLYDKIRIEFTDYSFDFRVDE